MSQRFKTISFGAAFLLMAVLINISIVIIAYSSNNDFYWALLFSIPALAFAIYYQKMVVKNEALNIKTNSNRNTLNENSNISFSSEVLADELNVLFGNSHCDEPYLSGIFCMDAGSLSKQTEVSLKETNLSNEHKVSPNVPADIENASYCRNDVIWQINPGYAGCRDNNFNFNRGIFSLNASRPSVKMIELNLPIATRKIDAFQKNNTHSLPVTRNQYLNISLKPITKHTAFSNPESMAIFLDSLRQLSGKKPVGIRFCINDEKKFNEICFAFRKTDIIPDYIVIETDANVYASPQDGELCLYEALELVSRTLELYGLKEKIKIVAATKIYSAMDVLKVLALGADAIRMNNKFSNRGKYYNAENIETDNPYNKSKTYFQNEILNDTINTIHEWGYKSIKDVTLPVFFRNIKSLQPEYFTETMDNRPAISPVAQVYLLKQKQDTKAKHPEIAF